MKRYRFYRNYLIMLIVLFGYMLCHSQCTDTTKICELNYSTIQSRKFTDVLNEKYKVKFKRVQTVQLTFADYDTVSFHVKGKKDRKAKFVLENLFFDNKEYNINTSYAIIARRPGTYQVRIKNRSFLNNEFYLSVQKVKKDSVIVKPPAPKVVHAPLDLQVDTLKSGLDTVLYIPCQLNLKKASMDQISFELNGSSPVFSTIIRRGIFSASLTKEKSQVTLPAGEACKFVLDDKQGRFEFLLDVYSLNSIQAKDIPVDSLVLISIKKSKERTDSLAKEIIRKDSLIKVFRHKAITQLYKTVSAECPVSVSPGTYTLALENRDRVVGKYYYIRIRETILDIKLKEEKK